MRLSVLGQYESRWLAGGLVWARIGHLLEHAV